MGYTTEFKSSFIVTPPLNPDQVAYLLAFSSARRMAREVTVLETVTDPLCEKVGLPLGEQGAYFIGEVNDNSECLTGVTNQNVPPTGQPGLWCQWIPSSDGAKIEWDQNEKFYNYREWLEYIMVHFLTPWACELSGSVTYQGESELDCGVINLDKNKTPEEITPEDCIDELSSRLHYLEKVILSVSQVVEQNDLGKHTSLENGDINLETMLDVASDNVREMIYIFTPDSDDYSDENECDGCCEECCSKEETTPIVTA